MIVCAEADFAVAPTDVLYRKGDAVRKLAVAMMVNIAESNTDMVCDMQEEYKTKEDIEAVFGSLNLTALDLLDDYIDDLRDSIKTQLIELRSQARVRRLEYDNDGRLVDITVDLKFGRE